MYNPREGFTGSVRAETHLIPLVERTNMLQKKVFTRAVSFAAAAMAAAVALSLMFAVAPAHASSDPKISVLKKGTLKVSYAPGNSDADSIGFWSDGRSKVSKLKSSKSAVAKAKLKYLKDRNTYIAEIKLKKAGTAKITCKVGSKKYAAKIKVYKYETPIASLKVGKQDLTDSLMPENLLRGSGASYEITAVGGTKAQKVKVVPADGWKISKIYTEKYSYKGGKEKKTVKKYKNGAKIKGQFYIDMKNKKTGLVETLHIYPF